MIDPAMDGINHINVYSKGKTKLGKLLSNFAYTPFKGGERIFGSVEAWWYWYLTGKQYDHLLPLHGFKAKQEGRKCRRVPDRVITEDMLKQVYERKLICNPYIKPLLDECDLPFEHYYVYGGKVVPSKFKWTATLWAQLRS